MRRVTVAIALTCLAISGCGGEESGGEGDDAVSLTLWAVPQYLALPGYEDQSANPGDWERFLVEEFQKDHPDVSVDVVSVDWGNVGTKVTASVQARQQPDIYFDANVRLLQWASAGITVDLNGLLGEETLGRIRPSALEAETVDGELVDMPVLADPAGALWCNPALFDAAGVPLPEDGVWTFDQFSEAGEKLAQNGKYLTVARLADEQGDYDWLGFFYGFGARPFSDDLSEATLASPEGAAAMTWLTEANEKGWLLPGSSTISFGDVSAAYNDGQLGCMGGTIRFQRNLDAAKAEGQAREEVGAKMMLYPYEASLDQPQFGQLPATAGYLVFDNEYSDRELEVIGDFLEFIAQEKYQVAQAEAGNGSPFVEAPMVAPAGVEDSVTASYVQMTEWLETYGTIEPGYAVPGFGSCRIDRVPQIQAGLIASVSAEEAVQAADDACNLAIENATVN